MCRALLYEITMAKARYDRTGLAMRQRVLGKQYVRRAQETATDFDLEFQQFITQYAWGSVWSRRGLDMRTRSLLTIVMLATLGCDQELSAHIRATANTGATADEVKEALLQVAIYAGVPAANAAFRIARATFAEMADAKGR